MRYLLKHIEASPDQVLLAKQVRRDEDGKKGHLHEYLATNPTSSAVISTEPDEGSPNSSQGIGSHRGMEPIHIAADLRPLLAHVLVAPPGLQGFILWYLLQV